MTDLDITPGNPCVTCGVPLVTSRQWATIPEHQRKELRRTETLSYRHTRGNCAKCSHHLRRTTATTKGGRLSAFVNDPANFRNKNYRWPEHELALGPGEWVPITAGPRAGTRRFVPIKQASRKP